MSDPPFGHHELHNRYCFKGSLKLITPLRISSGRASVITDAPLMRNREGTPYIPGSSLRGALRSELERLLSAAGPAAGLSACTLFENDGSDGACLTSSRDKREELREKGDEEAVRFLAENLCDLCKLFGSPVYASRLTIEDAYPDAPDSVKTKLAVRDGVGIDRDTGTARGGVKFDFEVLETGPTFCFRMVVENLGGNDQAIVDLALAILKEGLYVGGKRSAGLGRIRLTDCEVSGFSKPEELWQSLAAPGQGNDPTSSAPPWPPGGAE